MTGNMEPAEQEFVERDLALIRDDVLKHKEKQESHENTKTHNEKITYKDLT